MSVVEFELDSRGVARVTLNNPDSHNVLTREVITRLDSIAELVTADPEIRVVVLFARGKSFCAGADLGWMKQMMAADRATRKREARELAGMLYKWYRLPRPVIAGIEGNVYGGGLGLIATADTVIATRGVNFTLSEARLGLVPAIISPYLHARIGNAHAHLTFFSGRVFDARMAMEFGLVSMVVSAKTFVETVHEEVSLYLSCAPGAVSAGKELARTLHGPVTPEMIEMTVDLIADRWESEESAEGIEAFFARRKPRWQD